MQFFAQVRNAGAKVCRCQIPGVRFQVSGAQVSGARCQVSDANFKMLEICKMLRTYYIIKSTIFWKFQLLSDHFVSGEILWTCLDFVLMQIIKFKFPWERNRALVLPKHASQYVFFFFLKYFKTNPYCQ